MTIDDEEGRRAVDLDVSGERAEGGDLPGRGQLDGDRLFEFEAQALGRRGALVPVAGVTLVQSEEPLEVGVDDRVLGALRVPEEEHDDAPLLERGFDARLA